MLIVDTAGRLSIDEDLMDEIRHIAGAVQPDYTFLVIDAMTGQDAVSTAEAFHDALALDGVILTKLDGDARGGAALSVKEVVGRPIAFASTGEKLDDFDQFHPDRMADRILGHGGRAQPHRAGRAHDGQGRRHQGRGRHARGSVHPRGLPRAAPAGQEDGLHLGRDVAASRACPRT